MSKDIDIETVHDPGSDIITGFSVSYSAPSARVAQLVAGEVTNLFIDENLREREQESQETTSFIQKQLADARSALAEQDGKVREFEAAHEGSLPDQQASNLQILSGIQSQLQSEETTLNAAKGQRVYIQSLIQQYHTLHSTPHNAQGQPTTGLAGIDDELAKMRAQLADLSTKYTDEYPAVRRLKSQIVKMEKLREQTIADLRAGAASNKTAGSESSATDLEDPAQSASQLQLRSQLEANQIDINNHEQTIESLKARMNSYQERLNAEPANEQQLADLTRGYDQSKANYDDLLRKENESSMATSMEHMQQGERFTQLDPPSLPTKADFPNRLKFCGAGLGIGIVLGVVVAGAFEFFDGRMHEESEIKKLLPVAVISEIPEVVNPLDFRRSKRRAVVGWAVAVIVFVIILTGSALSYLHA
jgi:polysaccharide chain length determinant protein (PEP-CTERM system associated)